MKGKAIAIMSLFLLAAGSAYAFDDGDFQVWNIDAEELKISSNAKIAFEEEFRWGDNANVFYYHHYDAGLSYNLNKYLNVGGGCRQAYELRKGKFKEENEPYLTATLFWDLLGFKFDDRSRMEYRHFDYQDDSWRYRNKITVKLPWKFSRLKIQPFLSDEVLIGFSKINELNQNRFYSGLTMNVTKNIKAEIFYLLVSSKSSGTWVEANVLGTKLKIAF
jgi:hypothetical protein